ncbi:NLR family CARD domain-containing protein 4-like [Amphiura filiformis]|uniref:NLR family CARD domain-containing protein 4-like n=1 Tax=Amphiura filiformis TaxID=82378 RepID=UPI003B21E21D
MDNFVRCHEAVQLVCSAILPTLQKVLEDWHQRSLRNLGTCVQSCPNKGKPNPKKGFCPNCVAWGIAIEQAYFPQFTIGSMKWNNVDPTLFCKDPMEVAKVFVLRLPQGQVYGCLDDFDAASLLMLAMHFTPYHQGNQAFYDTLQKVFKVRNELCHLNIKDDMQLDDTVTTQYFDDIHDLIPYLATRYCTQDIVDQIQLDITKIQTSPVSARMKQQALSPVSKATKEMLVELIEEKLKEQESNTKDIQGVNLPPSLDVEVCKRQLKEHYLQSLCKIPKYPGDSETCLDMDEIYTNLSILYEMSKPCAPIKIPLNSHHDIFTRQVNGMLPRRILVLGRGGSGKSTLLAKIAYDWAMENADSPLKDLPLLFVLNMRWMQYTSSLEEAILHQLLPRDTELSKESIRYFLEQNPDRFMILLDSYDEFSRGEILGSNQTDGGNVVDTLANGYLTSCRVLVSSRHWRASDFSSLKKVYTNIDVEGFSKKRVREYIMKTFQESPDSGERLCEYIKTNNLFQIVSIPLMAQLFCLFWKEANEEDVPDKINDLYTSIFRILYNHFLAKHKNMIKLSLRSLEEVIVRLGECACLGLWPPQNRLVFPYEEVAELTSVGCVEDGCKIGIISIEKMTSTYKPIKQSEIQEQKSVIFLHKSAQEKCAGEYLSHLAETNSDEFTKRLQQLDSAQKCLSVQMVLRFACGSSLNAAKLILEKLVEILRLQLIDDVQAYYANTLRDPDKAKLVQEFIETCLLCNYESGSTGQFNLKMAKLFPTGKLQFLGLSPYTSEAIAHFLSCLQDQTVITKIKVIQIPRSGTITKFGSMAIVDGMIDSVSKNVNLIPTYEELEILYTEYVTGHQNCGDLEEFTKYVGQDIADGLANIGLWEYFKTWYSSDSDITIDPILDTVKFTSLEELDLTEIKLKDSGQKLLTVIEQGHLIHLTQLILPNTELSVEAMTSMVLCLPQTTPKLQVLDISDNNTRDSQVILTLTTSLPKLSLQKLEMDHMWAPASNMTALAKVIPQIYTNLTILYMNGNYMDDETGDTLMSTLPYALQLKELWMNVDRMSKKIHRKLVMTMGKLVLLENLGMHRSPYIDDLVLCMGKVIKSLSNLDNLALGASDADDNTDVSSTQSRLLRFLTRIKKSQNTACATTIPIVNRSSWQSFMSSLQPMAAQMQWLYLRDVNLHEADLRDLLNLCREHDIELGYNRRLWPAGMEIPQDIRLGAQTIYSAQKRQKV